MIRAAHRPDVRGTSMQRSPSALQHSRYRSRLRLVMGSRPLGVREPVYVPGLPVLGGKESLVLMDGSWRVAVQGGCNVSAATREIPRGSSRLRSAGPGRFVMVHGTQTIEHSLSGGACDGALPPRSSRTPGAPSSGRSARPGPEQPSESLWAPEHTNVVPDMERPGRSMPRSWEAREDRTISGASPWSFARCRIGRAA